jgi:hypothetical protein
MSTPGKNVKPLSLSEQLTIAQAEFAVFHMKLNTLFPDYLSLTNEAEQIKMEMSDLQKELNELKQKHRKELEELTSAEMISQVEQYFKEDKASYALAKKEMDVENQIKKMISMNQDLNKLLMQMNTQQARILDLETRVEMKKGVDTGIFIVETKFDLQRRILGIAKDTATLIKMLGEGALEIVKAIPPFRAAISGLLIIWDAIKTYASDAETRLSRGAKISAGVGILALTIAACIVAPATAVILGAVAVFLGATKDQIYPWRLARNKLNQKKHELNEINDRIAHVELGVYRVSDPNYIALLEQRDHLKVEVNQLKVDEWDKRKKFFNGAASIIGAVMVAIPFPPIQIVGVALLVLTGVVGLVQKYNLVTKAKNFFGWLGNKMFGKTKSISQDDRESPAPAPREKLAHQHSSELLATEKLLGITPGVKHSEAEVKRERESLQTEIKTVHAIQHPVAVKTTFTKEARVGPDNKLTNKHDDDETEGEGEKKSGPHP